MLSIYFFHLCYLFFTGIRHFHLSFFSVFYSFCGSFEILFASKVFERTLNKQQLFLPDFYYNDYFHLTIYEIFYLRNMIFKICIYTKYVHIYTHTHTHIHAYTYIHILVFVGLLSFSYLRVNLKLLSKFHGKIFYISCLWKKAIPPFLPISVFLVTSTNIYIHIFSFSPQIQFACNVKYGTRFESLK